MWAELKNINMKYKLLKKCVTSFDGDIIASCSANLFVKPYSDIGAQVLFESKCGEIVTVYKSLLKNKIKKQFSEL